MIPLAFITSWREIAPWPDDYQVEQDLVLSRALVDIFSSDAGEKLVLRGGTALNKLIVEEPVRYSEDIDLVQLTPEPIGDVFNYIRSRLDSYLGTPRRSFSDINATLKYRFDSEALPIVPLRLKIEINTREHDSYDILEEYNYAVENSWSRCSGELGKRAVAFVNASRESEFHLRNPFLASKYLSKMVALTGYSDHKNGKLIVNFVEEILHARSESFITLLPVLELLGRTGIPDAKVVYEKYIGCDIDA